MLGSTRGGRFPEKVCGLGVQEHSLATQAPRRACSGLAPGLPSEHWLPPAQQLRFSRWVGRRKGKDGKEKRSFTRCLEPGKDKASKTWSLNGEREKRRERREEEERRGSNRGGEHSSPQESEQPALAASRAPESRSCGGKDKDPLPVGVGRRDRKDHACLCYIEVRSPLFSTLLCPGWLTPADPITQAPPLLLAGRTNGRHWKEGGERGGATSSPHPACFGTSWVARTLPDHSPSRVGFFAQVLWGR